MDLEMVARLRTAEGLRALAAAEDVAGASDPLAAVTALRSAGIDAELAASALTQVSLRQRAAAKFGDDAARMFLTRAGLEQATRLVVATRRAGRLAAAGVSSIADLGCGIGADTIAFARAGMAVTAIDADPVTAAVAAANVETLGLDVSVRTGDATTMDLSGVDAVFCDPARRDTMRGRRIFDPDAYSPPWSFVAALPSRVPATVLKLAPGIDHTLIPPGAEAEWVSVGGDVVEATVWHGRLATTARRATVLGSEGAASLTGTGMLAAPTGPLRHYLYDPDGAVVRAHLVAEFASTVDGNLLDARIAYVTSDAPAATPFGTCLEVLAPLPYGVKHLRAALRAHDVGTLEIRKRGLAVDPDHLRRELRLQGSGSASLVLTRVGTRPVAYLCRPAPAHPR